ncbi:MAG: PLP-dependent aminotransferase family protein [Gammaproteobacteria bacterium]|jgi:DNA-binding transcriptional MocR family regulator
MGADLRGDMSEEYLYLQLANDLRNAIKQGVYGINERMPSLRRVSLHYKVSLATAVQAYQLLEDEGLLTARPKSGYFVQPWNSEQPLEPETSNPPFRATNVNVGALALSLINESKSSKLIKLGAAVPGANLLPLKVIARNMASVARRHWADAASYESPRGVLPLRRQIARLMRQAGCQCTPEDIIVTNGCLEALTLALRTVTKPGDTVAIESPTYFGVLQVMESLGLKALEVATHPSIGVDVDALEDAIHKKNISACILMPNNNNPLGSYMPDAHKQRVVTLLQQANITLIEDDVYGTLSYERPRPKAAKAYDKTGNVILCSSFSKTIAPGYRIGWLFSNTLSERMEYHKFLANISTATLPQLALAEFLARGSYSRSLQNSITIYRQRMDRLRFWINEYFPGDIRMSQPKGGFVLWLELPKHVDCVALYRKAMEKRIAISPGVLFCARGQYRHHIRLSCGAVEGETMRKAIKTLGSLISSQ